ncbi:MAG TPA: hypothetical protein PLL87_05225 [Syntrophorhabdaceae bacterium]|nr:hypothetical protein [Syntrophorhabdaceae bacterium]
MEKKGFKDSRSEGFEDSRGQVEKDRGLDGWRVGGLAKNQEAKGSRSEGFKDLEKKGFKDSRIRGVKWRKTED